MLLPFIIELTCLLATGYGLIIVLIFIFGDRDTEVNKNPTYRPKVSIIIPTRNEREIIEARLRNIQRLDYPRNRLQVIFIDDSTDGTYEILEHKAKENEALEVLRQEKPGFNQAMNQGFLKATGEIVVKSDCDAFPRPDALKKIVENFADPTVGAVSGIHSLDPKENPTESIFRRIQYKIQSVESYFHSSLVSHGAFAGYRKELIPRLPSQLTSDDSTIIVNVVREGYRAILDKRVISSEIYPEDFQERRSMKQRRVAGIIRVMFENLDLIFNPKYGYFGFLSLPINFFILVISPIATTILLMLTILQILFFPNLLVVGLGGIGIVLFIIDWKKTKKLRAVIDVQVTSLLGIFSAFTSKISWKSLNHRVPKESQN